MENCGGAAVSGRIDFFRTYAFHQTLMIQSEKCLPAKRQMFPFLEQGHFLLP